MQNRKRVGDQLGREEREADRISQAVKTHMNESSGLFKKKKRKCSFHFDAAVWFKSHKLSVIEGELVTCDGRKYPKKSFDFMISEHETCRFWHERRACVLNIK